MHRATIFGIIHVIMVTNLLQSSGMGGNVAEIGGWAVDRGERVVWVAVQPRGLREEKRGWEIALVRSPLDE